MRLWITVLILAVSCSFLGCSRTQKVTAYETGSEIAYVHLGTLEVQEKAQDMDPRHAMMQGLEVATLTLADSPSRAEIYKASLRKKLAEVAKRKYGAHAVIHVTYWPDPSMDKFPEGKVFARGEMIRYKPFPEKEDVV